MTWVRALPSTSARASISSLVRSPAPVSRQTRRNGALVTPAIGASRRSTKSVYQGDRADRRTVGPFDLQRQRQKAAALDPDLVEVREVFHDGDPGREEPVVSRALLARELRPGREDAGAHRVVGRIVVADNLHPARDQPLAG